MNNQRHLYAVISDIHANYQALRAVEKDAQNLARKEQLGKPVFVCLGDVVDYGPQPNECMAWVRRWAKITIQGNHDIASAEGIYVSPAPHDINREYWPITLWTRQVLANSHKHAIQEWKPKRCAPPGLDRFTLFHGDVVSPTARLDNPKRATQAMQRLSTDYGLFGHTHHQGYFGEANTTPFVACPDKEASGEKWQTVPVGSWEPLPNSWHKAVLNPGSVGQPRHHPVLIDLGAARDPRAAYMLLLVGSNGNSRFQFRRVTYKVKRTVQQLREIVRQLRENDNNKRSPEGEDVLKDNGHPEGPRDSEETHLKQILRELPERLDKLVEETLIPTLMGRS